METEVLKELIVAQRLLKPLIKEAWDKLLDQSLGILQWPKRLMEMIKNRRLAVKKIEEGFRLMNGKLYTRAMLEFQSALKLCQSVTLKSLENKFIEFKASGELQAALSVGIVVLLAKDRDYKLANKLGNITRKLDNHKQANNLYKKALRINRDYDYAMYNLAASMGNVKKYDQEIKQIISKYVVSEDFVTPAYKNNPRIVDEITNDLTNQKIERKAEEIKQLEKEKKEKEKALESYTVLKIGVAIKKMKATSTEPTYEEIRAEMQKLTEWDVSHQHTQEEREKRHGAIFNLGIFAFKNGEMDLSIKCFENLKNENSSIELLDMVDILILHEQGQTPLAVKRLFDLLRDDLHNRYYNINMGLIYRKSGNVLNSLRYLAVGADLLEKSEGLYPISEMMDLAIEREQRRSFKKALNILNTVTSEQYIEVAWLAKGRILQKMQKPSEAVIAYKTILEADSTCDVPKIKLAEIHDEFVEKAEEAYINNRIGQAAALYEKALNAQRHTQTIEKMIDLYRQLNKRGKVHELINERNRLIKEEKERADELLRQSYIKQGKLFIRRKAYRMAIKELERAFRMKLDKSVFSMLVDLYEGLKLKGDLKNLVVQWEKMNRIEENFQLEKKIMERENRGDVVDESA